MQEMTASTWKRTGSSIVWHPDLLADLVRDIEPTPLRELLGWLKTGFPEDTPGGHQTVLIGGLQTVVDTMMQANAPDIVEGWVRANVQASVRIAQHHWPKVGMVFVMDGPESLARLNEGDEIVYFGRGNDRSRKVKLSSGLWNGAASGEGAYQLLVENSREVGGYFVKRLS